MNSSDRKKILDALRQRAEADRILGAAAWPISRAALRRAVQPAPAANATASARTTALAAADTDGGVASAVRRDGVALPFDGSRQSIPSPAPPRAAAGPAFTPRPAATLSSMATQHADPAEIAERHRALDTLNATQVRNCKKCGLCSTRTQTVFGQGSPIPRIIFVGEAPGFDEDRTGLAFVGRAGQLLTNMIERGMGLKRDDVFICNVIKCRPPDNRTPAADEIAACSPYLFEQLRTLQPEVIIALGAPAAQTLLSTTESIGRLRGRFHDFCLSGAPLGDEPPIPLMPTYHPAYLLRSPGEKGKAWDDLKQVLRRLNLPVPGEA